MSKEFMRFVVLHINHLQKCHGRLEMSGQDMYKKFVLGDQCSSDKGHKATVCAGLCIFQQRVTFFAHRVTFFTHGVTLEQFFVGPTHGVKIELHAVI